MGATLGVAYFVVLVTTNGISAIISHYLSQKLLITMKESKTMILKKTESIYEILISTTISILVAITMNCATPSATELG
jgi:hypothetical protein